MIADPGTGWIYRSGRCAAGALNEDLRDLVKSLSSVQPDDLIANVLMTHALLIHLRSANISA